MSGLYYFARTDQPLTWVLSGGRDFSNGEIRNLPTQIINTSLPFIIDNIKKFSNCNNVYTEIYYGYQTVRVKLDDEADEAVFMMWASSIDLLGVLIYGATNWNQRSIKDLTSKNNMI